MLSLKNLNKKKCCKTRQAYSTNFENDSPARKALDENFKTQLNNNSILKFYLNSTVSAISPLKSCTI